MWRVARVYTAHGATMKRPVGVILTAILQFLGSLAVLAMSASAVFLIARLPTTPGLAPPPTLPAGMSLGIAAFYGLFAVLGFLTAIGLFRMRSWGTLLHLDLRRVCGSCFANCGIGVCLDGDAGNHKIAG